MQAAEILAQSRLFRDLSEAHKQKLASIAEISTHVGGATLVKQGSRDQNIYLLGSGSARVVKETSANKIEEVARFAAGAAIGEMAFVDGEPRSTSVEAIESIELLTLRADALSPLLDDDAELRSAIYSAIASLLTRRLRGATDDIATLRAVLKRH